MTGLLWCHCSPNADVLRKTSRAVSATLPAAACLCKGNWEIWDSRTGRPRAVFIHLHAVGVVLAPQKLIRYLPLQQLWDVRRCFYRSNAERKQNNEGSKELLTFRVDTCGTGRDWSQISPTKAVHFEYGAITKWQSLTFLKRLLQSCKFSVRLPQEHLQRTLWQEIMKPDLFYTWHSIFLHPSCCIWCGFF